MRNAPAHGYARAEVMRSAGRLIEWARKAPASRPDDEYIHELRVRLRRARAGMRSFRRFYSSRGDFERRVDRLRRLSRALGPLRDADVTAELLDSTLSKAPHRPAKVVQMLRAHRRAREQRWRRVRPALEALARLEPEALAPPPGGAGGPEAGGAVPLGQHARRTLRRRFEKVWALRRALATRDPLDLHALRIQIKRLRYSVEAFDAIAGASGRRWGEALRRLQSTLGEIQDHTVALALVERYLAAERRPLETASLQRLKSSLTAHREWLIARFLLEWRRARVGRLQALLRKL